MRYRLLVVALGVVASGCGTDGGARTPAPVSPSATTTAPAPAPPATPDAAVAAVPVDAPPPPGTYADLAEALAAILPADARVLGFGELHARTDRAQVRSALSHFTAALPRFGDKLSDLIVETWIVDPKCGQTATTATKQLETEVKRPEATKSEIALLADAAKAARIQPHAMRLSCDDYKTLVPKGQVDPVAMLTLTTRELTRIAVSAVVHRNKEPAHRPWIALYGGALHNDRDPEAGVAEWSYTKAVRKVTGDDGYVEVDLIVPELAEADAQSKKQPWYALVERAADRVQVFTRNPRSFVVVLARTK